MQMLQVVFKIDLFTYLLVFMCLFESIINLCVSCRVILKWVLFLLVVKGKTWAAMRRKRLFSKYIPWLASYFSISVIFNNMYIVSVDM